MKDKLTLGLGLGVIPMLSHYVYTNTSQCQKHQNSTHYLKHFGRKMFTGVWFAYSHTTLTVQPVSHPWILKVSAGERDR